MDDNFQDVRNSGIPSSSSNVQPSASVGFGQVIPTSVGLPANAPQPQPLPAPAPASIPPAAPTAPLPTQPIASFAQAPTAPAVPAAPAQPSVTQTPAPQPTTPPAVPKGPRFHLNFNWKKNWKYLAFGALGLLVIGGIILVANTVLSKKAAQNAAINRYETIQIPLNDLVSQQGGLSLLGTRSLVINGPLTANDSFTISPSAQPSAANRGQIYYDQGNNLLAYYNGTKFVELPGNDGVVQSFGGFTGQLTLGQGLNGANGQISNSGVLTVQGQTGNVTLVGGPGVAIDGTTISNTGITSFGGQTGDITIGNGLGLTGNQLDNTGVISATGGTGITVTDDGAGNITISNTGAGTGTVQSPGGTSGRIAKFTGVQTIADSLLSETGTTVTVNGDLAVTGGLTLGTALTVGNGGTGTTALAANGVVIGQGSGALTAVTAGAAGQCLMSTAGIPAFQACPGGGGGVTSLNGLTGALTLADATAAGSTVTINDASTTQKGIAQFNAANFTAASGVINTVQNISVTATPTFGALTLTSSQATSPMLFVNNTNAGATGNLIDLQQSGSSRLSVSPAGNMTLTGTLNGQTISSAANFTGTLAVAGAASLNGGATVTGTLTANTITPTGALTVGATNQSLTLQGNASSTITATSGANTTTVSFQTPTANVNYRLLTAAAGTYDICTTAGNCAGVGGGVTTPGGTTNTIPKFTGAQTIGNSIITDNGSTVTIGGVLSVNTVTSTGALTVGSTGQSLTLQGTTTSLSSTSSGITNTLTFATPSGSNKTITLPNASGTVVVSASGPLAIDAAGNITCATCSTSGAVVTSLNGLTGALAVANASGSGSTITINDASTSQKGIAQFNSTNFTASSGTINTIQDISTASAPSFGRLTLASSQATNAMFLVNNTNAGATGNLLDLQLNGGSQLSVSPAGSLTLVGTVNGQTISSAANLTGTLAVAGAASLNGGATVTGTLTANTITPTGALTVGATNQSFLVQGSSTSTITATSGANTTTLSFQNPTANVTYRFLTATAGTYDVCTTAGNCTGVGGGVTTPGGTTNTIPKFTGAQTIGNSIITDNGSTVTIGGTLAVNTLTPTAALTIGATAQDVTLQGAVVNLKSTASGITNSLTFATPSGSNKTITIPNATGTLVVSANGPLAIDAAGNITCATCTTGTAVSSLDGLTGALTISDTSGSGSVITINDASTSQKGIAQFNSTNFTAASGVINTIQNIDTAAAPTFGRLTVTSSQASNGMFLVNNTNASATGNLIDLQLNGSSKLSVSPAGNLTLTGTVNGQTISSAASLTGTLAVAGAASLNGGASVTGTLTANTITPTGALTVGATGQSFLVQGNASSTITATNGANTTTVAFQSPTASVTYRLLTAAAGTYDICTTVGNCSGVGGGVTTPGGTTNALAKFTGSQTIGDSIITDNGSTVTIGGTLAVNTITPSAAMTIGATTQNLTLQGATTSLTATSGGITNTLTFATPSTSNKTITVPNATGTVAVSASGPLAIDANGNITCSTCVTSGGGGGGVGAVDSLDGLTGALTLANSTGSGTTVTIDDASTSQKGIAQFNSTNFTAASGVINTIQNINSTASPTFGQLTLTSSQASAAMLTVNNTNVSATGNLIDLQLNGSSKLSVTPAGAMTVAGTINGQTISSSANFTGTLAVTGAASLNGGATVTGTLTANTITPTGALTVGATGQSFLLQGNASSSITATDSGSTTTVNFQTPTANVTYRLLTAAAGTYDICTTVGNCAGVGGGVTTAGGTTGKIAKFTGSNAIGDSLLSESGSTVTLAGTLAVNTITPTGAFTIGATTQNVTLQGATTSITSTSGANTNTLSFVTPSGGSKTINVPNEAGTLCIQNSTNCGFAPTSGSGNYIQNGTTLQTANFNIQSSAASSIAARIEGAAGQSTQVLLVKAGSSPTANALEVQNSSGTQIFAVDPQNTRVVVGSGGSCTSGRLCVGQTNNGAGGGTSINLYNLQSVNTSGTTTMINQDIVINDTSTAIANTLKPVVIDTSGSTNASAIINSIFAKIPSGQTGTFLELQNGSADVLNISNAGVTVFQNTTNTTAAFQVLNAAGRNVLKVDTTAAALTLGNITATAGQGVAGTIVLADGTNDNFGVTLNTTTLTANRTITLPNATGTVCLQNAASCGFATGTGNAFVQGGNTFGAAGDLGTNDSNALNLRTNSTTRVAIAANGADVTLSSNTDLILQGATAYFTNTQGQTASESFGQGATVSGSNALAVGNGATAVGHAVAIGNAAGVTSGTFGGPVSIGDAANGGSWGVAIGQNSSNGGNNNVAIGNAASAAADNAIAIGANSVANQRSIAIGGSTNTGGNDRIVIGYGATATADGQLVVGSNSSAITQAFIGNGVTNAAPSSVSLQATGGSGTNIAGASLNIVGGAGTGSANGGSINFKVATPGTSGSSANVPATVATISGTNGSALFKNVVNSATGFQVQNAASNNIFSINTSTPSVVIQGTGTNGSGGRLYFGGDSNVSVGEDTGDSDVLRVDTRVATRFYIDGTYIGEFGQNGNLNINARNGFGGLNVTDSIGHNILSAAGDGSTVSVGYSDTVGALLVLDTKTNAGDPTGINGGMYYNSSTGKFRCYQNSGWSDCITTDTGVTSIGTIDSQTKSANGAVITGTSLVLQTADATAPGLVSTGTQTFAGSKTFTGNNTLFQPGTNSTTTLNVKASGGGNIFTIDTTNSRIGINLGSNNLPATTLEVGGALRLSGSSVDTFITPNGSSVPSKINIPVYDPGSFGQILAFGVSATAQSTSRALSLMDARTGVHQPTIAVFSPNENNIIGLNWNGTNTTAYLATNDNTAGTTPDIVTQSGSVTGGNGNSGAVYLQSGGVTGGAGGYNTGSIAIQSGNASGTTANSGAISIDAGTATGTIGAINIGAANSTSINIGHTAGTTNATTTVKGLTVLRPNTDSLTTLKVTDASGNQLFAVGGAGGVVQTELGNPNVFTGKLKFDAASSSNAITLVGLASPSANRTITLPDADGTVCLDSGNCGGSTGYILNQSASDQTASFRISGTGRANTSILTPLLDTPTAAVLALGTSTATAINLNQNTAVASNKTFTVNGTTLLQPATNNINAVVIKDSGGTNTILNADTINQRIGIGGTATFSKFEVINGDAAIYNSGNNPRLILGDSTAGGQNGYLQWDSANDYFRIESVGTNGLKINDNFVTIGNIFPDQPLKVASGTTLLAQVNTTGSAIFRTSTNATTGFQVQDTGGTNTIFDVDTTNKRVGIGTNAPARTLDIVTNTSTTSDPTFRILQNGTADAALDLNNNASNFTFGIDTSDSGKFKISSAAANGATVNAGYTTPSLGLSPDGGNGALISASQITTGGSSGTLNSISVYLGSVPSGGHIKVGLYSDNGSNVPNALLANSNEVTAVANSWNTIPVTTSISASTKYWIGFRVDSNSTAYYFGTGAGISSYANNTYAAAWNNPFNQVSTSGQAYAVYLTYTPTATVDAFNGNLFSLTSTGAAVFKNSTDSTDSFAIQNSSGLALLTTDTTNTTASANLITNSGFENDTTGWSAKGTVATFITSYTQHHSGHASLYPEGAGSANSGAKYNITLFDNVTYTASFYAKVGTGDQSTNTIVAGYSSDGTTDNTACTQNTPTLTSTSWVRTTCTFTTPGSHSGTPFFYIKQTDASNRDLFIDDVILQLDSNIFADPRNGSIDFQAAVSSPLTLAGATNFANAFNVLNANSSSIFNVDTTDVYNLVSNPSFEQNDNSWGGIGSGASEQEDPSQSYVGNWSLKVTTGTTANSGASYSIGNTSNKLNISTTYTLSWYAKLNSGTFTDIKGRYTRNGSSFVECTPTAQTVSTTGWTRFTCTFATDSTAPTGSAAVQIVQTGTSSAHVFWIDGVRLEQGSTARPYGNGSISFDANFTSPLAVRSLSDSTSAFNVVNTSNTSIFNIDTLNSKLTGTAALNLQSGANTSTALTVANSAGANIVSIGTSNGTANLIPNVSSPDFESSGNVNGWTAQGTSTTVSQDTTYAYSGTGALKIITGTAADSGARLVLNPVQTSASTNYTVSFFARKATGDVVPFTDMIVRYSPNGSATADCNVTGMNSQTVVAGWTRYWCTVNSATTPTTSGYIQIKDSTGAAHTFWIDAVQLEPGNIIPTAYGTGTLSLNSVINSPVAIRNINDSTNALSVTNTGNDRLINFDTLNNQINIGMVLAGSTSPTRLTFGDTDANSPPIWLNESSTDAYGVTQVDSDVLELHAGQGFVFSTAYTPIQRVAIDDTGALKISDNLQSQTKGYRFRTSGGGLDLETTGVGTAGELWLTGWTGAAYSGTQVTFFRTAASQNLLMIGANLGTSTPTLLELDQKNTSGDPTGYTGAMYYNSSSNEFRCYETFWRNCIASARTEYHFINEMIGTVSGENSGFYSGNSGAFSGGAIAGTTGHPGIAQLSTATTTNGYAAVGSQDTGQSYLFGNGDYWRYESVVRIPTLSTAADIFTVRSGMFDGSTTDGTDGCFFRYTHGTNSGKWQGVCNNNTTTSTCDTGITVAANTWYRLTLQVNTAGNSVDFATDGTSRCQVTTNIPTSAGRETSWNAAIAKGGGTTGTTARTLQIDYVEILGQLGTSR